MAPLGTSLGTASSADTEALANSTTHDSKRDAVVDKMRSAADTVKDKLHLESVRESRPVKFLRPTNVRVRVRRRNSQDSQDISPDIALLWRSRDNRKGRRSIAIPRAYSTQPSKYFPDGPPGLSSSKAEVLKGIGRMFTTIPYWDISYWVGVWFAIGSLIFTLSGLLAWLTVAYPNTEFEGENKYVVAIMTFIGVLMFEAGAGLAFLEAVNDGSFHGSMMARLLEGNQGEEKRLVDEKIHSFFQHLIPYHHNEDDAATDPEMGWATKSRRERPGSLYPPNKAPAPRRGAVDFGGESGESHEYQRFRLWPTWYNFRHHHIYQIGFLACFIQFIGATIFIVNGTTILPGIQENLTTLQFDLAYYMPDTIASVMFTVASVFFTVETQETWWRPAPKILGWWIGAWSLVGSIGFTINGALGFGIANSRVDYQSGLASFWGSAAFLISSTLQIYEAVNKNVIEEFSDDSDG